MLDAFIIERLKEQQREERERRHQPMVPIPEYPTPTEPPPPRKQDTPLGRGVVIIDMALRG